MGWFAKFLDRITPEPVPQTRGLVSLNAPPPKGVAQVRAEQEERKRLGIPEPFSDPREFDFD